MSLYKTLITILLVISIAGCTSMATQRLADNLASAMLNQDDPETVRAGAPAYLLLLDSMIQDDPDNEAMLLAGARLYTAFGSGLITDKARASRLLARARDYARRAVCQQLPPLCRHETSPYQQFIQAVDKLQPNQINALYAYATSWASWIKINRGDWGAVADLPKVEYLLELVVKLAPDHDNGRAHLYLAVMKSQLPPSLGGKPEIGRRHFELAIAHSDGRDLIAKVEYARTYARMLFDQPLHDRLLNEVLTADPRQAELTLSNILAQQQAKRLLEEEYF